MEYSDLYYAQLRAFDRYFAPYNSEQKEVVVASSVEDSRMERIHDLTSQLAQRDDRIAKLEVQVRYLQMRLIVASLDDQTHPYDWNEDSMPNNPEGPQPSP